MVNLEFMISFDSLLGSLVVSRLWWRNKQDILHGVHMHKDY